jgi:hypothetical protein
MAGELFEVDRSSVGPYTFKLIADRCRDLHVDLETEFPEGK